jgi:hypothetical protein
MKHRPARANIIALLLEMNVDGPVKGQICWDGGEVAAGASQLEGREGKKYYLGVGTRASQSEAGVTPKRKYSTWN